MPFDFAVEIKSKLILIEYQGEQHYRSIEWFGGDRMFEIRKRNDTFKKEYCRKNKMKLIIISYKDFNKIEEILKKELKS
jgi:hypothetical protein